MPLRTVIRAAGQQSPAQAHGHQRPVYRVSAPPPIDVPHLRMMHFTSSLAILGA